MKISHTVDINSKPETVFHWVGDPKRARVWMSSVSQTEIVHESAGWVGTTFRESVEGNGGSTELRGVVTDYKPNQRIAFQMNAESLTIDVEFCLEPIEDGTRLTQSANLRFTTLFMKVLSLFFGPRLRKQISEQSLKEFGHLKELCEAGARQ